MERAVSASVAAFIFGAFVGVIARSVASVLLAAYRARREAADDALRHESASLHAELSELDAASEMLSPMQPMGDLRTGVFTCAEFLARASSSSQMIEGLLSDDGRILGSFGSAVECAEAFAAFLTKAETEAAKVTVSASESLAAAGGGMAAGAAAEALVRTVAASVISDTNRWRALGDAAIITWTQRLNAARLFQTAELLLASDTRNRLLDLFSLHVVLTLWAFACDANICFSVSARQPRIVQFNHKVHACGSKTSAKVALVGAELISRVPRNKSRAPASEGELRRLSASLRTFALAL